MHVHLSDYNNMVSNENRTSVHFCRNLLSIWATYDAEGLRRSEWMINEPEAQQLGLSTQDVEQLDMLKYRLTNMQASMANQVCSTYYLNIFGIVKHCYKCSSSVSL